MANGVTVLTFEEALADARDHAERPNVLLGNGFSIACRADRFTYAALLDEASFDGAQGDVRGVFELLGTVDFENVIASLQSAAALIERYGSDDPELVTRLRTDVEVIRDALATTLAAKHPDLPYDIEDAEYDAARLFLSNFDRIYTLNYDMLLYWAVMHEGEHETPKNDGFTDPDDPEADYVVWEPYLDFEAQRLFFLHGGLHLYDTGSEISKITWSRTGIPLVDQIRQALSEGRYPLIVTEGSSSEKEGKILHNAYLMHALRSLSRTSKPLFIYGHSLADSDAHILKRLEEGKGKRLYVSIFGEHTSESNRAIIARAEQIAAARPDTRPLAVQFFDAASARAWG
jgi:hypothetical protein